MEPNIETLKGDLQRLIRARNDICSWSTAARMLHQHHEFSNELKKEKEFHLVRSKKILSQSDIKYYSYMIIRNCYESGCPPSVEIIDWMRVLLGQDALPRTLGVSRRGRSLQKAKEYIEEFPNSTDREVAVYSGIHHSTVSRNRRNGKLPSRRDYDV